MDYYDIAIIGAGAMGSAAAYYLSETSKSIILIEQYQLGHKEGSTHGQSRVIRRTYTAPHFAEMMDEAYLLWNELMAKSQAPLYIRTGGIDFGSPENENLQKTIEICVRNKIDHEILEYKELKKRYPAIKFEDGDIGIYQKDTGIVNPEETLSYFHTRAQKNGVKIHPNTKVKTIDTGNPIKLSTSQGEISCDKLIITAGSWVNSVLDSFTIELNVKIWHLLYAFYKVKKPEIYNRDSFPVFINWGAENFYGFPINERDGLVKIAPHTSEEIPIYDTRKPEIQPSDVLLERLSEYVNERFNSIVPHPTVVETCYYTMTNDENFIIDYMPNNRNVIIAAGFSGHGFKFTPLIGKVLAEMIVDGSSKWHIAEFRLP